MKAKLRVSLQGGYNGLLGKGKNINVQHFLFKEGQFTIQSFHPMSKVKCLQLYFINKLFPFLWTCDIIQVIMQQPYRLIRKNIFHF